MTQVIKTRTYWISFKGRNGITPSNSKSQYIVIEAINAFTEPYQNKDMGDEIWGAWRIEISTREHETIQLVYFNKEEADREFQKILDCFTNKEETRNESNSTGQ